MLAIVIIDKIAILVRIRKLIAPAAWRRIVVSADLDQPKLCPAPDPDRSGGSAYVCRTLGIAVRTADEARMAPM